VTLVDVDDLAWSCILAAPITLSTNIFTVVYALICAQNGVSLA
jgi:hypothetical protein